MQRCDVLIVGGGPAGSTCAWALQRAGADVLVLDRAAFPRDKVCAGWITPSVLRALQLDPAAYRAAGLVMQDFHGFRTSVIAGRPIETRYTEPISHGIRRCEFDHFLLRRSGARVLPRTPLASLRRDGDGWIANDTIAARVVVGAGGHFCPVARQRRGTPRERMLVVAQEAELPLTDPDSCTVASDMPELYFCRDLEGYGWCVRKGAFLNVGLGRRDQHAFPAHIRAFMAWLAESGRAPAEALRATWRGHAYLLAGASPTPPVDDGLLLVGDAAGLAYRESGEGIRPAVESALLAAGTLVAANGRYGRDDLMPYASTLSTHVPADGGPTSWIPRAAVPPLGRLLLSSAAFTRRVVLDRWFLRGERAA
ncbi:MAG TPA: NAD(P)/FAD-dependent oxidoreductase [Vicinamibacterales bacterium]|nr:NAD(P)/FAD-dependent oxidoreductase [Vicinamibacterales bacterium]